MKKLEGKVAVITGGSSGIGLATAKRFVEEGAHVVITGRREKELKEAGALIKADIIFLAVRFQSHPDVAKALPTWQGKTIIDVTNAYGVPPEELGGQPSSKFVAQAFRGAMLVKGFNHLVAAILDQDPALHGGRRVVFLASDDEDAAAEIDALAEKLGFAPIKLGGLSEGGLLVQARGNSWRRLIFKDLVKFSG